jgi:hypothetical protein
MRQVVVGDSSALVDQLVDSCRIRPPAGSSYTGYGRDLVPFFELHEPVGNPTMVSGPLEGHKEGQRSAPQPRTGHRIVPCKMHAFQPFAHTSSPAQLNRRGQDTARSPPSVRQAGIEVFCAPGFSQSPKPEALPLPTRLLAKALASCKSASYESTACALTALRVAAV